MRSGIATTLPQAEWPPLFKREKARILAALFPKTVVAYRSAFDGMGAQTIYLTGGSYARVMELPGLKVVLSSGPGPIDGDTQIQGRELYFPRTQPGCCLTQLHRPRARTIRSTTARSAPRNSRGA